MGISLGLVLTLVIREAGATEAHLERSESPCALVVCQGRVRQTLAFGYQSGSSSPLVGDSKGRHVVPKLATDLCLRSAAATCWASPITRAPPASPCSAQPDLDSRALPLPLGPGLARLGGPGGGAVAIVRDLSGSVTQF